MGFMKTHFLIIFRNKLLDNNMIKNVSWLGYHQEAGNFWLARSSWQYWWDTKLHVLQSNTCSWESQQLTSVNCWLWKWKDVSTFQIFFLYFLDLGFSQEFIASDQKQGNKILMTSSATMGLNFWSKIGSPIPMTSQWPQTASVFAVSNKFPFFWSE